MQAMQTLDQLANRFAGVSLEYRRSGHAWPAPWRVRTMMTKNERDDQRIECFGETAELAVEALLKALAAQGVKL